MEEKTIILEDIITLIDQSTDFYLFTNNNQGGYKQIGRFCKDDIGLEHYLYKTVTSLCVNDDVLEIEIEL